MEGLDSLEFGKILVYLGPSLSLAKAKEILPQAIYRPPAKAGDITTDTVGLSPNVILLIDGEVRQNLSPWHKEIVYALQHPSVKAIYGAASMGALRAAELEYIGMIGVGKIFRWYRDGVTEDDSEVVLNYAYREATGSYHHLTVPLVDIRAGVEHYEREFAKEPQVLEKVRKFWDLMQATYYMVRTPSFCEQSWAEHTSEAEKDLLSHFPCIPQKELDAIELLTDFSLYVSQGQLTPNPSHLSTAFQALYDRERRIEIGGQSIPQMHIDSYLLLHNLEFERICWDSANQELALILCNALMVTVSLEEAERESNRFQQRCGIETMEDFNHMLASNGWTKVEYDRLMVQNTRIHKLQHSLTVSKAGRRNTRALLDYLRTHQAFDYWAIQAAQKEAIIAQKGIDDWQGIDLEIPVWKMLADHFESEGLELKCSQEEYLLETGFSNPHELTVTLNRLAAARET